MSHQDSTGAALEGGQSYRLRVPPNVPIRQYWSMTANDRQTHAFIRKVSATSRSSQTPGLRINRDGSVDLMLGPTATKGWERNWLPTDPNHRYELMARFYGPQPALFDQSWRLLEVERMARQHRRNCSRVAFSVHIRGRLVIRLPFRTPITRGAAIVGKCLIRRTTQGVSRGFDSHHPLHFICVAMHGRANSRLRLPRSSAADAGLHRIPPDRVGAQPAALMHHRPCRAGGALHGRLDVTRPRPVVMQGDLHLRRYRRQTSRRQTFRYFKRGCSRQRWQERVRVRRTDCAFGR